MKLYSGPLSLFTAKVRIALDEKAVDYERVEVGWSLEDRYLPHHPEVVRLNPKAQVPVLVDGDLVVYDSTRILEYLEDRYPSPPLYPKDAVDRARCRQLEAAADEITFPDIWSLIEESFYPAGEGGRDESRRAAATASLQQQFAGLDSTLAGREFLCGDFSVADIGSFVMVRTAQNLDVAPGEDLTAVQAWLARLEERPSTGGDMRGMQAFLTERLAARS